MTPYPVPDWLDQFARSIPELPPEQFSRFLPPPHGGRRESAVLILFAPGVDHPDRTTVVVTERAHALRSHPGQPAFPGGGLEPQDPDLVHTALREADEEIDLPPDRVQILATLPTLHIPVSGYDVTPVLGWWLDPEPGRLWAKDPREVERVLQPEVAQLIDPASRFQVRHPSGYTGPAWEVDGLVVWGFTAGLLDRVLELSGIAQEWDRTVVRPLRL